MAEIAAFLAALLSCTLVVLTPRQTAARNIPTTTPKTSPTNEELASSLFVNQIAILELMHNSENTSCAAAALPSESDADSEATQRLEEMLGTRMDRVLAALEVQQQHTQQVLDTVNSTAINTLAKVQEVQEEMAKIVEDMQMSANQTTGQSEEREAAAVPEVEFSGAIVHNDSITSLCSGDKILFGTIGLLEVVRSGNYPHNKKCSWSLNFPVESSVSLSWDYFQLESCDSCSCDWVDVRHNSQPVYERKLCGIVDSSSREFDLTLHKVNNLLISFRSDGSYENRGFRLEYRAY